ncbi:uncharacterized protein [Diabrotica undecimpunctata]|uniref:uncharacterized protein isoform X4 n=1 Tax=Diabrotica undecimpunctata TaxID=50387 RepID=UPI003B6320F9
MNNNSNMLQLCRLCLVKDEVNIPIFEEQGDIRQIFLKISSCLPVKVSRDDQLPKKICDGCSYKLDMLYEFWNTSANAEKQLLTWLGEAGMTSQMTDGTISAVAQQIKPADAFVKQETIDPPDILKDDDDEDEEDKDYMKQEESSNNVTEEPPPKRARRTAAVKAAIALDQNSDDDDDSGEPMTKVEDDSDDSDNDDHEPAFVDVPSTSADDQPGPSGVGKEGVEAPSVSVHSSGEEIDGEKEKRDQVHCVVINKKIYEVETNVASSMFSENENDDDTEELQVTEIIDNDLVPPMVIDSCSNSSTMSADEEIETEVFLNGEADKGVETDAAIGNEIESEIGVTDEGEKIAEVDAAVDNDIEKEIDLTDESGTLEETDESVENDSRAASKICAVMETNTAMETDNNKVAAMEAVDSKEDAKAVTDIICVEDSENSDNSEEEDSDSRSAANNNEDLDNLDDRFVEEENVFVNQDPEEDPLCDPLVMPEDDIITIEDDTGDQIIKKSIPNNVRTLKKPTKSPGLYHNAQGTLPKDSNDVQNRSLRKDSFYERYSEFVKSTAECEIAWSAAQAKKQTIPRKPRMPNKTKNTKKQKPLPPAPPTDDPIYIVPKNSTAVNINGEIYLLIPDTGENNQISQNSHHLSSSNITPQPSFSELDTILQPQSNYLPKFPSQPIPIDVVRGHPPSQFLRHPPPSGIVSEHSPNYVTHHTLPSEIVRTDSPKSFSHNSLTSDNVGGSTVHYFPRIPLQCELASGNPPSFLPQHLLSDTVTNHLRNVPTDVVPGQYSSLNVLSDYVSNTDISVERFINCKKGTTVPINVTKRRKKTVKDKKNTAPDTPQFVQYYQEEGRGKSKTKGNRLTVANIASLEENVQSTIVLEQRLPMITSVMSLESSADDTNEIIVLPDKKKERLKPTHNIPSGSKDDIEEALPLYYIDKDRDVIDLGSCSDDSLL